MSIKTFLTNPATENWDVDGYGITKVKGISGVATSPTNFSNPKEKVDVNVSGAVIILPNTEPDVNYGVTIIPSWDSRVWVPRLSKTTSQFEVHWNISPPDPLGTPTDPTAGHTVGGALPTGTYYYVITAEDDGGETLKTAEVFDTSTGTTNQIQLNATNPTGAIRNRIYRGVSTGNQTGYLIANSLPYTDDGTVALTSGTPPTVNESGGGWISWLIFR